MSALDDFVPTDHAVLHRPVNIALLGVDGLFLRERHDETAAPERAVVDLASRFIEGAAFDQLDVAADHRDDVLPFLQSRAVDDRHNGIGHA